LYLLVLELKQVHHRLEISKMQLQYVLPMKHKVF
jgi:hypothetical protein